MRSLFSSDSLYCSTLRRSRSVLQFFTLTAGGTGALLLATAALGATPPDAQARYQSERAACLNGTTHQDQQTCLQEAGAMLQEVKRGRILVMDEQQYKSNRVTRCDPLPVGDREDCLRRMAGEGSTTGAAETGGIYRELSRSVPPPAAQNKSP